MSLTKNIARLLADYDNPRSMGSRLRAKRIQTLVELMRRCHAERGTVSILDVGGTKPYWNLISEDVLAACGAKITVLNLPGKPSPPDDARFTFVRGDGCDLSMFPDRSFDIAHSNSVIEHVGDWQRMRRFAAESQRVARNVFCQTPYFWFPVEPHFMVPFFNWLPEPWRVKWLMRSSLGHVSRAATLDDAIATIETTRLLDHAMLQALFPSATIKKEKVLLLTKSLIAVGGAQT